MASVRAAAVAGMFYPADPRSLDAELDELLGAIDAPAAASRGQRSRASAGACARSAAALSAAPARRVFARAVRGRRRHGGRGGAGDRAPVGRARDPDRHLYRSLALPPIRAGLRD